MGLCGSCWGDEAHSSKYSKFWSIVLGSSCPIQPTITRRNVRIARKTKLLASLAMMCKDLLKGGLIESAFFIASPCGTYASYPRSLARSVRWRLGSDMFSDVSADGRPLGTCF